MSRSLGWALVTVLVAGCVGSQASLPASDAPTGAAPTSTAAASAPPTDPPASPSASASGSEPTEAPTAPSCPPADVITVAAFVAADPSCIDSADVRIRAWLDRPAATGWEGPLIKPLWLAYPPDVVEFVSLWSEVPVEPGHVCASAGCAWIFVHLSPVSEVSLVGPARWVIATGHRNDPAAERCRYDAEGYRDADARAVCREQFVLVALEDIAE